MSAEHFRKLEHMYHSAPSNQQADPRLEVEQAAARVCKEIESSMHHAAGAVHGHWLFKLLDDAAFFAANSLVEDTFVLTVNFDVHLLKPAGVGELVARGTVVHEGSSSLLAQAIVFDEEEDQVARGTGSFVKGARSLETIEAYRRGPTEIEAGDQGEG